MRERVTRDITMAVGRVSDTMIVTASRNAESRATVTQSVTVATAEDIDALGSASLADVVRFVPGVAVEGNNGREGAVTSLYSRGGENAYFDSIRTHGISSNPVTSLLADTTSV
jgi:outer membrane cobalamin receptor